jgi:putative transposase
LIPLRQSRECSHFFFYSGGLGVTELRRLKQLEEENRQLKKLVANLSLDKQMLQDVLSKKF